MYQQQGPFAFNNPRLKGAAGGPSSSSAPIRDKYDPATMPADCCSGPDMYNHRHYFTGAFEAMCWAETERRTQKMKKYLEKLPWKQGMAAAREADKKRFPLSPEDKWYNKLKCHETHYPNVSPLQESWTSLNNPIYHQWRSLPPSSFSEYTRNSHCFDFVPAPVSMFEVLPAQQPFQPGSSFTAKVSHIVSFCHFYLVPSSHPGSGVCDGDFVLEAFTNRSSNEDYSYLLKSSHHYDDPEPETIAQNISFHRNREETDPNSPPPIFPSLGEKDKDFYYSQPGYLDLWRRNEDANDIQEAVLVKKICDQWRSSYYADRVRKKVVPSMLYEIQNDYRFFDYLSQEEIEETREFLEEQARIAFFPSKPSPDFVTLTRELSSFFDNLFVFPHPTDEPHQLPLLQFKGKDGYIPDELVAVYLEFAMLPVESLLYGFVDEGRGVRGGWLRARVINSYPVNDHLKDLQTRCNYSEHEHPDDYRKYIVHLLDYGPRIHVSDKFILRLPQQFTLIPPMAYECSLINVDSFGRDPVLSSADTQAFLHLVENQLLNVSLPCSSTDQQQSGTLGVFLSLHNAHTFTDISIQLNKITGLPLESVFVSPDLEQKLTDTYGLTQEELWAFRTFNETNQQEEKQQAVEESAAKEKLPQKDDPFFHVRKPKYAMNWKLGGCLQSSPSSSPAWIAQWIKFGVHAIDIEAYHNFTLEKHELWQPTPQMTREEKDKILDEWIRNSDYYKDALARKSRFEEDEKAREQRRACPQPREPGQPPDLLEGFYFHQWQEAQIEKEKRRPKHK